MHDAQVIDGLERKFNALAGDLDERGRRRWAATEALELGYGGITAVALATGLSDRTIRTGIRELQANEPLPSTRQRQPGGGRKPLENDQPDLIDAVDRLVEPTEFAVEAIRGWWRRLGKKRYAKPTRLLITADSGGSNGHRNRLWKYELQRCADQTGMIIEVCHYPPGTSKWNKIEHRLFCHITRNWRGVPLETHQVVVSLVSSTRTDKGREVHCRLDEND